jgi:hypothetical protein
MNSVSAFEAIWRHIIQRTLPRTRLALVPPKPKLFDSARRSCAHGGIRRPDPASAFHRRIVQVDRRRRDLIADRQDAEDRLDRARRAQQMPDRGFGRGHDRVRGMIAQQPLDRAQLDRVGHGRGAMRVDIVEIRGLQPGPLQRRRHAAEAAIAILADGAVM